MAVNHNTWCSSILRKQASIKSTHLSLCHHWGLTWVVSLRCQLGFWILEPPLVPVTRRLNCGSFPSLSLDHSKPQTSTPPAQESKWQLNTNEPWRANRDMWATMLCVPKNLFVNLTHSWLTGTNTKSFLKISTWRVHVFTRWCRLCLWQLRAHAEKQFRFKREWFKRRRS